MTEPAAFYTGLVSELYRPLRASDPDPEPYARFIALAGEPALELGCGDGDPLLELRKRGLDVEGVDSSSDMLDRCRRRAEQEGIEVVLHHQRMEELDLGDRRYRTIFLAGATFTLLPDDDAATRALLAIRRHLDPDGGQALIPLFIPTPPTDEEVGRPREAVDEHGTTIRFRILGVERDDAARRQQTMTRYERGDEVLERPWVVHWHTQDGFRALAAAAGLETVAILGGNGQPASPTATEFAFWLRSLHTTAPTDAGVRRSPS